MKVIGVRFKSSGRIYYFDPLEFEFREGDGVIVETARGQEFGEVAQIAMDVEETAIVSPLKPVVRPASDQDTTMREQNCAKEGDAFRVCQQKIDQHKLDMRLVSAEYSFNGSKLVFYFTADERVDFRELVKDLASQFRTRIELRQIGVRDEAKMLGGLGSCGRVVCCKQFLDDFHPVSIKMAKEQNLSLSPTKISGLCGRLMCCLQYEQSCYEDMKRRMPHVNREILTPDGLGMVIDNNVITEKTKVRVNLPDGSIEMREFHYTLLAKPGEQLPMQPQAAQPAQAAQPVQAAQAVTASPRPERIPQTAPRPAADSAGAQERNPEHKRRRRGGRGKGAPRPEGAALAPVGAPQQNGQPRPNQPRPQGQQQQQQQQRRPDGQPPRPNQPRPQQQGQPQQGQPQQQGQPRQGNAPEGQRNNNNNMNSNNTGGGNTGNNSRNRRGGANRPRPEGTTPTPPKQES